MMSSGYSQCPPVGVPTVDIDLLYGNYNNPLEISTVLENNEFILRMESEPGTTRLAIFDAQNNLEEISDASNQFFVGGSLTEDVVNPVTLEPISYGNREATDILIIAQKAQEFFCFQFGRELIEEYTQVHIDSRPDPSLGEGPLVDAGDRIIDMPWNGNGVRPDVVVHELAHIYQFLNYPELSNTDEGEALQEGFADIIGTVVENYITSEPEWWILGDDTRNFSDPPPALYDDEEDYNDLGEHAQGEILTHWFYLLVEEYGNCNRTLWDMLQILLNCFDLLMDEDIIDYPGLRELTLDHLHGTFRGDCSQCYIDAVNAWAALDVGDSYSQYPPLSTEVTIVEGPCSVGINWPDRAIPRYYWSLTDESGSE